MNSVSNHKKKVINSHQGFTLIELIVALALSLIVTSISYSTFIYVQRSFTSQEQVSEMQSTNMISIEFMAKDIKETGFGTPRYFENICSQEEVVELKNDEGFFGTDQLFLIGGFRQLAVLNSSSSIGDEYIIVKYPSGNPPTFDTEHLKNLSVMGLQHLKVVLIEPVSTTPEGEKVEKLIFEGQSLNKAFPKDSPVFLIENVFYHVDNQGDFTKVGCAGMPAYNHKIADNIDNMQFVGFDENRDSKFKRLEVYLITKSDRPDPNYKGHQLSFDEATNQWSKSSSSDHYRRRLLSLTGAFRNRL